MKFYFSIKWHCLQAKDTSLVPLLYNIFTKTESNDRQCFQVLGAQTFLLWDQKIMKFIPRFHLLELESTIALSSLNWLRYQTLKEASTVLHPKVISLEKSKCEIQSSKNNEINFKKTEPKRDRGAELPFPEIALALSADRTRKTVHLRTERLDLADILLDQKG